MRGQGIPLSNPPNPTISLGYLIDNGYLSITFKVLDPRNRYFLPSERAALCCTLARSLLHLSHGDWTRVNWEIDGIYFLQDPSTHQLLDKDKPYLSWTLDNNPSRGKSETQDGTAKDATSFHSIILVNFARLLMEVYGHQRITFDQPIENLHSFLFECNYEINELNVRSAVEACLGSEGSEAAQDHSNPGRFRDFISQRVLQRLEANKKIHEEPRLDELRSMSPRAHPLSNRQPTPSHKSPYDGTEYNTPEDPS